MAHIRHGIDVLRRHRFFQPKQAEGLEFLRYTLRRPSVVPPVHITGEFHFLGNGFTYMLDPADHTINLGIVGRPVGVVKAVWIGSIIQVNLHGGEALLFNPWKFFGRLRA